MRRIFSAVLLTVLTASVAFGASAQSTVPTASSPTLNRIRQSGTIRFAYRDDDAPFSFKSGTGEPIGYMVELCKAVAKTLPQFANLPQLKIVWVPVTSVTRFDAIRQGQADVLCDSSTATLDRRKIVDFSISTFVDGAGILVKDKKIKDLSELNGTKIGVLAGTTTQQALANGLKAANVSATVVTATSYHDGLNQLDAGTISAFFGDRSILLYLIPQSKAPASLNLADNYLTTEPYAMALPRGDDDFRLAVDVALSRIYRSGAIVPIYAATFNRNVIDATLVLFYAVTSLPE
jgi:ABC-type amino acid transport substrate-binding protein